MKSKEEATSAVLSAAERLAANAEAYYASDGPGCWAAKQYWDDLFNALDALKKI